MQVMNRFNTMDGFSGGNEFDDEREMGMFPQPGQTPTQKITVNLEDAVLEEQKLSQILEVSGFLSQRAIRQAP